MKGHVTHIDHQYHFDETVAFSSIQENPKTQLPPARQRSHVEQATLLYHSLPVVEMVALFIYYGCGYVKIQVFRWWYLNPQFLFKSKVL